MQKIFSFIKKITRYCMVGAVASLVDYGSYFLFTRLLYIAPHGANVVAYVCGNVVSFLGHRFFTFHTTDNPQIFREYARFLVVTIIGLAISQAIVVFSLQAGITDLIGKGFAVVVSGLFNFIVNSLWTFKPCANNDKK